MEFSDLELVHLWHVLNLSVNDLEKTNLPARLFEDGHSTYILWSRINVEVQTRNIAPHEWTKTVTVPEQIIPATTKTINL